ncbi:DEAD/DEAH box helicase [Blattabacterium cuenoti]|uniref:DEAD/DEAH box helicase n=1 Tax=Blattabacterium cuenoti TaxID=1653831 RepID=UPI00163BA6AE|nr:DEAD/DEAH box helicase [Blattabacterium cuenoti]
MKTFYNLLNKHILRALEDLGFINPTQVQQKVIPYILKSDKDLIALSQTGTGKTAAFGIPIIQKTKLNLYHPQTLILCPTRELCLQITSDLRGFAKYIPIQVIPLYGGMNINQQIIYLKKHVHIIVGTPGRINDLIRRRKLSLYNIKYLILDEADEMLNMGFKEELDTIIIKLPKQRQSLLFSATMSNHINIIAKNYLIDPIEIIIGEKNIGSNDVKHIYYVVNKKNNKYFTLKKIMDVNPNIYGIIFCQTRKKTKELANSLIKDGYNADALYGDLTQFQRESVMNRFRNKTLQLLVATDVASRGLDVHDITHVINYNIPNESKIYVHRSGRTGRAGNSGISICILHTHKETRYLKEFEKKIGTSFQRITIPTDKEICEKQLLNFIDKVKNVSVDNKLINIFLPTIENQLGSFNKEELIKRLFWIEFSRLFYIYKNSKEAVLSKSSCVVKKSASRSTKKVNY